jgi:hypothetical protein
MNHQAVAGIVKNDPKSDGFAVRAGRTVSSISNEGCLDDHFEPSLPRLPHLEKDVVFDDIAVFSDQFDGKVVTPAPIVARLSGRHSLDDLGQPLGHFIAPKVEYPGFIVVGVNQEGIERFAVSRPARKAMKRESHFHIEDFGCMGTPSGAVEAEDARMKMRQVVDPSAVIEVLPLHRL